MKIKLWIAVIVIAAAALFAAPQTQPIPDAEKEAIIRTALDYGDGFYSGAAERMERALYYDLNKVVVTTIPQTGKHVLNYSTFSGLVEMTRAKVALLDADKRKIQGYALRLNGDIACAKITSALYNDFLQMVKIDGQWKIVNVLWVFGPDQPNRPAIPGYDPAKDEPAVLAAVRDLVDGYYSGDAAKVEKAVHPEVSLANLVTMPTGRTAIMRVRYSGLVENVRMRAGKMPANLPKPEIKVIDGMDGMAFVEVKAADAWFYLQMNVIGGEWKVINILIKRLPAPPPAKK